MRCKCSPFASAGRRIKLLEEKKKDLADRHLCEALKRCGGGKGKFAKVRLKKKKRGWDEVGENSTRSCICRNPKEREKGKGGRLNSPISSQRVIILTKGKKPPEEYRPGREDLGKKKRSARRKTLLR